MLSLVRCCAQLGLLEGVQAPGADEEHGQKSPDHDPGRDLRLQAQVTDVADQGREVKHFPA